MRGQDSGLSEWVSKGLRCCAREPKRAARGLM